MREALSAPPYLRSPLLVWLPSIENQAGLKNWRIINPGETVLQGVREA